MKDPTNWITKKKEIGKHRKQRAKRGFSDQDWWNFDTYLSFVIIGGCEKFKTGHGYPCSLASMEEWIDVLDKIIDGYKANMELKELNVPRDMPYKEWSEGLDARYQASAKLFAEYMPNMWD